MTVVASDARRVLMVVTDGFEDAEAVTVLDACGWTQYRPHLASVVVDDAQ